MMNEFSFPPLGLRWLLSQRSLRLIPINHADQQFSTIQNLELADPSDYIQSPSVMLTLGLSLTNQSGQFRDYAQRMAKAGVVAIGFGTGMKHDEVPVELVHATAELGLGLFEIPKEISFISITTTAQAEQVRQLNAQKEAIDKEISALSREAQERGLEALVEYCASLCGGGFRWKSKC